MPDEENVEISDYGTSVQILESTDSITITDGSITNEINNSFDLVEVNTSDVIVEISETVGSSINGAVFITDISAQNSSDNVSNKVFEDGALKSFTSTTKNLTIAITAFTGSKTFKPVISIFNSIVNLSESGTVGIWYGTINVTVPDGVFSITAKHSEGPHWNVDFDMETVLSITSAVFIGDYPGTQTELKENDHFSFYVVSNQNFFKLEIEDFGAFKSQTVVVAGLSEYSGIGVIANRGNVKTEYGFKVRVQSELGTWSDWFECVDTISLNNLKPTISGSVSYPNGQLAIKSGEFATLNLSALNFDTYSCTSTQLIVPNSNLFESTKLLEMSLSTNYNISSNNVFITAHREANNSTSSASILVKIVNVAATFTVSALTRLRSGGNFNTSQQTHTLYISSNQPLISAPSFSAPSGSLSGSFSGAGSSWQTSITIHDDDEKGTFQLSDFIGYGLSKIPAIGSGQYTIGGFVKRILTIPAWPSRSSLIGTNVVDVSKLRCTNLSKGASGSLNFTYKSDTSEEVNKYTIIGLNEWYNCDGTNASSNTSGLMQIELEEIT